MNWLNEEFINIGTTTLHSCALFTSTSSENAMLSNHVFTGTISTNVQLTV